MKDVHLILETLFRHVQNLSTDGMQGHVKFQQKDLEAADGHFREACHKVQAVVNLQVGLSIPAEGHEIICNRVCKSVTVSSGLFAFQLLTTHGYFMVVCSFQQIYSYAKICTVCIIATPLNRVWFPLRQRRHSRRTMSAEVCAVSMGPNYCSYFPAV